MTRSFIDMTEFQRHTYVITCRNVAMSQVRQWFLYCVKSDHHSIFLRKIAFFLNTWSKVYFLPSFYCSSLREISKRFLSRSIKMRSRTCSWSSDFYSARIWRVFLDIERDFYKYCPASSRALDKNRLLGPARSAGISMRARMGPHGALKLVPRI